MCFVNEPLEVVLYLDKEFILCAFCAAWKRGSLGIVGRE